MIEGRKRGVEEPERWAFFPLFFKEKAKKAFNLVIVPAFQNPSIFRPWLPAPKAAELRRTVASDMKRRLLHVQVY